MFRNIMKYTKKFGIIVCLLGLIFFTLLEFISYSNLGSIDTKNVGLVLQENRILLFVGLMGSISILIFLTIYFYLTLFKPLKAISAEVNSVAEQGFTSLSRSLFELAHGNLTTTIKLDTAIIKSNVNGRVGQMTKGFNSIIKNLHEASKEFNSATDNPCKRLFYVGADPYLEGRICADEMARLLNGKGKVAVFLGNLDFHSQQLRYKGFQNFLSERFSLIKVVELLEDKGNPELFYTSTKNLIHKYPDLNGIYIAHTGDLSVNTALEYAKNGKIKFICHDLGNATMPLINQGIISATLSQDAFAQGHDPIIHLFNHFAAKWDPPHPRLLTNMELVTNKNYTKYWQQDKGLIESDELASKRPVPLKTSIRQIRIAFIGKEGNSFWDAIKCGVDSASKKLDQYNAKVDWIIPKSYDVQGKSNDSAEVYIPAIEDCVDKKYDAICIGVFDKNLVNHINKVVDKGVVVATFNCEPISLRGLLKTLSDRTKSMSQFSFNLSNAAQHTVESSECNSQTIQNIAQSLNEELSSINTATSNMSQIATSVNNIAKDSHVQKLAVDQVAASAYEISKAIGAANQGAREVVKSSAEAFDVAEQGAKSVKQNLDQMNTIEETVNHFAIKIQGMVKQSEQIEGIINTIESIADKTNLLALNAAIEAARAGEYGRGFAVVADEVRNLAESSAHATKQTSSLISKVRKDMFDASSSIKLVVDKVREGTSIANQSGQALDKLMDSSKGMSKQIDVMVNANKSVGNTMESLFGSIEKISSVIDQNMSATEELSMGVKHTVEMITNIATISDFNATTINEISVKTIKAKNEAKDLGEVAKELAGVTNELKAATAQFKIDS